MSICRRRLQSTTSGAQIEGSKAVEGWSSSRRRSVQAGACPRGWMGSRAAEVRGADVQAEASIGKRAERRRRPWRHGVAAGDLNQLDGGGALPDSRSCLLRLSSSPSPLFPPARCCDGASPCGSIGVISARSSLPSRTVHPLPTFPFPRAHRSVFSSCARKAPAFFPQRAHPP